MGERVVGEKEGPSPWGVRKRKKTGGGKVRKKKILDEGKKHPGIKG